MSIFVVLKETILLTLKILHYGHSFTITGCEKAQNDLWLR